MTAFEFPDHPEDCISCKHRQLRAFCNLSPEALRDYDQIGWLIVHERGTELFSEGNSAWSVMVICSGQVKISTTSRDGKTMILKIAGPGDVLGLSAILSNVLHEVTAEVIESCQIKDVPKLEFLAFLGRHGIATMHAMGSLSADYLAVFKDARRLALSASAGGRLARILLDWGRSASQGKPELRFTMALTHEELGDMAGVSRETVTRLLNQFRRDRWIIIKGSSMTISNPEQLESLTALCRRPQNTGLCDVNASPKVVSRHPSEGQGG